MFEPVDFLFQVVQDAIMLAGQSYRELHEARAESLVAHTSYKGRALKEVDKELFGTNFINKDDDEIVKEVNSKSKQSIKTLGFEKI